MTDDKEIWPGFSMRDVKSALAKSASDRAALMERYQEAANCICAIAPSAPTEEERRRIHHALATLGPTIKEYSKIDAEVPSPAGLRKEIEHLQRAARVMRNFRDHRSFIDNAAEEKPNWHQIDSQIEALLRSCQHALRDLPEGPEAPKKIEPRLPAARGVDARAATAIVILEACKMLWPNAAIGPDRHGAHDACRALYAAATDKRIERAEGSEGNGWRRWLNKAKLEKTELASGFRDHAALVLRMNPLPQCTEQA